MSTYGQYCPLALAAEIFCERWNVLIIRRIIEGSYRFNDIHKGVPKITATLLSRRLRDLEHAEIITRTPLDRGPGYAYRLTAAGEELAPIIQSLAYWGQAWGRDMVIDDLDPDFLLWQMHGRLNKSILPPGRTVIALEFTGGTQGSQRFWLIATADEVDMCLKHPGHEADLTIMSDLRLFVECWRGIRDIRQELSQGAIRTEGTSDLVRLLPDLLLLSAAAPVKRQRCGVERDLAQGKPSE
ncbi:winged helix-turn-helix transcriptional regulator [Paremcibacter congregatus]|nr:helix-turn-helix domain-containing protein [Paremcibacter congregatus]